MKTENNKEQNQIEQKSTRPWQGVVLALIYLPALIQGFIYLINTIIRTQSFDIIVGSKFLIFFAIPVNTLIVVMSVGTFKGKRLAVQGFLILTVFGILMSLIQFTGFSIAFFRNLLFGFFALFLVIVCLKHPFYIYTKK